MRLASPRTWRQLAAHPRALLLASGVVGLFALVPGFPTIVFLILAACTAWVGAALIRQQRRSAADAQRVEVPAATREGELAPMLMHSFTAARTGADRSSDRPPSSFRLELSRVLIERHGTAALNTHLAAERARLRDRFGIPFPGLTLRVSDALAPGAFSVVVQDLAALTLSIPDASVLLVGRTGAALSQVSQRQGARDDVAPEWLLPAAWVSDADLHGLRGELEARRADAMELLEPMHVVARLVTRTIQRHPEAALGVQEVKQMIQDIEWRFGALAREAQAILPLGRLADLMAALARERVPLADFPGLLQAVVTHAPGASDTHALYEAMRLSMARGIVASLLPDRHPESSSQQLFVVTLDAAFEAKLQAATVMRPDGPVLALPPPEAQQVLHAFIAAFERAAPSGAVTLALAAPIRRAASRLFRGALPRAAFLSYEELSAASIVTAEAARATFVEAKTTPV